MKKIIFLDNHDSFVYSLVDLIKGENREVQIFRPPQILEALKNKDLFKNSLVLLSPGPSHPQTSPALMETIQELLGKVPLLGICLGHQALALQLGAEVRQLPTGPVHGKWATLSFKAEDAQHPLAQGLPQSFTVGRYHSLYAHGEIKETKILVKHQGIPMVICSSQFQMVGIQFHPESILSPYGQKLLQNSLKYLEEL